MPDHRRMRSSGIEFASGPSLSARMARSGCGSRTGKTGGFTGRGGIAMRSASLAITWSVRSCRSTTPQPALWSVPKRSGLSHRPTWAGRSGATCWNSRSSAPRNAPAPRRPIGGERQRSQRLWGRIAAKEAARRLWSESGAPPFIPADLAIVGDERDWPRITRVGQTDASIAAGPLDRSRRRSRRRPGRARADCPSGHRRGTDRRS